MISTQADVAIVGGGPAGSTVASLLSKYNPRLRVVILEREKFPRDHVGESQLPLISQILDEMGVWDKVERCDFPIKVGATYRWGQTQDLWDFEFLDEGVLKPEPRPAKYQGQRQQTAFQVDRAIYDKVLLDHAKSLGAEVHEEVTVREVRTDGDRVTGLITADGAEITARHYVDASGHIGLIRRAMGVEVESPTTLQNIAIWDYWQNADWAVSIGVGGTRVQVLSLGYGWIWFIPLGPTRTSIGLIVPAEYYKQSGKRPQDLYDEALNSDAIIRALTQNATSEGKLSTTKDWSFLAERLAGENWFLAGESAGFADPILAAGMTLAHMGARDVAYTILALDKQTYEPEWLRERYNESQKRQILQHIRFADFWYTHNGIFTDLKDFTSQLAAEHHGLELTADEAWRWFGRGGFIDHDTGDTGFGGYSIGAVKQMSAAFLNDKAYFAISGMSHFQANLDGATRGWGVTLDAGRIDRHRTYSRDGKIVPNKGVPGWLLQATKEPVNLDGIQEAVLRKAIEERLTQGDIPRLRQQVIESLEAMVSDGWIRAWAEEGADKVPNYNLGFDSVVHPNRDIAQRFSE